MSAEALAAEAQRCGIEVGYHHGSTGEWVTAPSKTLEALIDLLGEAPVDTAPPTGRCFVEEVPRWGWALQPYSARSRSSWGIGDLGDLRRIVEWTAARRGTVMVTPMSAGSVVEPVTDSPYFPSSRIWLDPVSIDVSAVTAGLDLPGLPELSARAERLNASDLIDRDAVWRVKRAALEAAHSSRRWPEADGFRAKHPDLERWAVFCAISEEHGSCWQRWPHDLRSPDSAAVRTFARERADRVSFHSWLQWVTHSQLAPSADGLVADLAVGIDPGGADAWIFAGQVLDGATVGAPPDEFAPGGQSWAIAALHPHRLVTSEGEVFKRTIDAIMGLAAGIRIDHVMGLFRLFIIPDGMDPSEGAYVRYPSQHLLAWLAAASQEHRCFVIGEDLGTVEPAVRETMAAMDMLGFRVLLFDDDVASYPQMSVAVATTHDLPTIPGLLSGKDIEARSAIDADIDAEAYAAMRGRIVATAGTEEIGDAVNGAYATLARSPSALVLATFQDALGATERPNMPGTTTAWPNWKIPLSLALEEVLTDPRVNALAEVLSSR